MVAQSAPAGRLVNQSNPNKSKGHASATVVPRRRHSDLELEANEAAIERRKRDILRERRILAAVTCLCCVASIVSESLFNAFHFFFTIDPAPGVARGAIHGLLGDCERGAEEFHGRCARTQESPRRVARLRDQRAEESQRRRSIRAIEYVCRFYWPRFRLPRQFSLAAHQVLVTPVFQFRFDRTHGNVIKREEPFFRGDESMDAVSSTRLSYFFCL